MKHTTEPLAQLDGLDAEAARQIAADLRLVCDVGVQSSGRFTPRPKLYVRWELPQERIQWTDREGNAQEGPAQIGKFYTASLSAKANLLRKDLENWRGRALKSSARRRYPAATRSPRSRSMSRQGGI